MIYCQLAYAGMPEGYEAYTRGNYTAAFAEFSAAAKQDHPAAQNMVAAMYAQGRGVERDYKQALDWLYRAQALGSPEAMFNLARLHEEGLGEPKNTVAALKYYREAAHLGFKPAIQRLKLLEAQGLLVTNSVTSTSSPPKPHPAVVDKPKPAVTKIPPIKPVAQVSAVKPALPAAKPDSLTPQMPQMPQASSPKTDRTRKLFIGGNDSRASLNSYLKTLKSRISQRLVKTDGDSEMMLSIAIQKDGRISNIELSTGKPSAIDQKIIDLIKTIDRLPPLPKAILLEYDELDVSLKLPIAN